MALSSTKPPCKNCAPCTLGSGGHILWTGDVHWMVGVHKLWEGCHRETACVWFTSTMSAVLLEQQPAQLERSDLTIGPQTSPWVALTTCSRDALSNFESPLRRSSLLSARESLETTGASCIQSSAVLRTVFAPPVCTAVAPVDHESSREESSSSLQHRTSLPACPT